MAAVELASQLLSECHHLVLTCNGEGELYRRCQKDARSLALLMPPKTHDRSFAMTSSLTSMMLSCLAVFLPRQFNPIASQPLIALGDAILPQAELKVPEWDRPLPERVIYLGSGSLQGVAQEAALKLLELTFYEEKTNEKPILLLDDVFSELDPDRQQMLLDSIKGCQTIITTTHIEKYLESRTHAGLKAIKQGQITPLPAAIE